MKTITLKFTDTQAREIGYYLRKKYKVDKRAWLSRLCELVIIDEIQAQAKQGLDDFNAKGDATNQDLYAEIAK